MPVVEVKQQLGAGDGMSLWGYYQHNRLGLTAKENVSRM
jgi:hypothetical protein